MAVLAVWAVAISVIGRAQGQPAMTGVAPGSPAPGLPTPGPTTTPSLSATPSAAPTPSASSPAGAPSGSADAGTDPRLRFVEFQLRLADAAPDVRDRGQDLLDAARAEDDPATVAAAVAILDLVDRERDWLAGHPPTACYADAHRAAGTMLRAYGSVADAAIAYAEARGLDRLEALAVVGARAESAAGALRGLETALEAATCLG